jgi:hypothetical protein
MPGSGSLEGLGAAGVLAGPSKPLPSRDSEYWDSLIDELLLIASTFFDTQSRAARHDATWCKAIIPSLVAVHMLCVANNCALLAQSKSCLLFDLKRLVTVTWQSLRVILSCPLSQCISQVPIMQSHAKQKASTALWQLWQMGRRYGSLGGASMPSSRNLWDVVKREHFEPHSAQYCRDIWMQVSLRSRSPTRLSTAHLGCCAFPRPATSPHQPWPLQFHSDPAKQRVATVLQKPQYSQFTHNASKRQGSGGRDGVSGGLLHWWHRGTETRFTAAATHTYTTRVLAHISMVALLS